VTEPKRVEMSEHVERLMRDFAPGTVVRAALPISYVTAPHVGDIAAGTLGTVLARGNCTGLYEVRWNGHERAVTTTADVIDPLEN
jgi:hypothetical protein